jgi:hypothetical protein
MARVHYCHQHDDRPLAAHCALCQRPCCRDCAIELFEQHFCETCKHVVSQSIERDAVQPDALRSALLAAVGIFVAGFVLGPYALWRAWGTARLLEQTPWLRGRWHVRAAYVLGAIATLQGLIQLWGRFFGAGAGA